MTSLSEILDLKPEFLGFRCIDLSGSFWWTAAESEVMSCHWRVWVYPGMFYVLAARHYHELGPSGLTKPFIWTNLQFQLQWPPRRPLHGCLGPTTSCTTVNAVAAVHSYRHRCRCRCDPLMLRHDCPFAAVDMANASIFAIIDAAPQPPLLGGPLPP